MSSLARSLRLGGKVAALSVLFAVASADPAAAAGFTESEVTINGVPGPSPPAPNPRNCNGPGGACSIKATLFLPDPLPPGGKAPAIVMSPGFRENRQTASVRKAAELFATQGYVVLTYDARGFGQSQGYVMVDSPEHEVKDIGVLIDYLTSRAEVSLDVFADPRVGLYGQSYGGAVGLVAAALDPRVDVLVARMTWHDLSYTLVPNGIVKIQWLVQLFLGGEQDTQGSIVPDLAQRISEITVLNDLPAGTRDELRKRSPVAYGGQVRVPTFILQGERDTLFNLVEASSNIGLVSATGAPTKLMWFFGGHGYTDYPNADRQWVPDDPMESRQLKWMNRYLKNDGAVETGPPLEYNDEKGVLRSAERVPPVASVSLPIDRAGLSLTKPPGRACPPSGIPNCSYTEASNFSAPGRPGDVAPFDPPGTFISLDTAPLEGPLPILGNPNISFKVTTQTGQPVSLFWKFFDVAPDGSAKLINRLVSPIRASSGKDHSLDLAGFSYTFARGNKLRLMLATTDAAYYGTELADQVTLAGPVSLNLPVASSEAAGPKPAPAPEAGSRQAGPLPETGGRDLRGVAILLLVSAALARVSARRLTPKPR